MPAVNNPYHVVKIFEEVIAEFAGAPYAVAVESGTAALFLSLQYSKTLNPIGEVTIPAFTYPSVPASIIHAGGRPRFTKEPWNGVYELEPLRIIDGALRFRKDMYEPDSLHCLSFHVKKLLPIGRGGMILTDSAKAAAWLKRARFDGRPEAPLDRGDITMVGWNMYMTPEQASRGLLLFQALQNYEMPDLPVADQGYPDLSKEGVFRV